MTLTIFHCLKIHSIIIRVRVYLFKDEIERMINFRKKIGRKICLECVWLDRKENKWWDSCIFSPDSSKSFLSKIERKLRERNSWNKLLKIPLKFTIKFPMYWLFFCYWLVDFFFSLAFFSFVTDVMVFIFFFFFFSFIWT